MKKPSFLDLTQKQKESYGNGCGVRYLPVPSFTFDSSCRHHDFNWERGCGANYWYENLWKAPYYYVKGNTDFYLHMLKNSYKWWHPIAAFIYYVGVMLFSWPWFSIGPWKSVKEILKRDERAKLI